MNVLKILLISKLYKFMLTLISNNIKEIILFIPIFTNI